MFPDSEGVGPALPGLDKSPQGGYTKTMFSNGFIGAPVCGEPLGSSGVPMGSTGFPGFAWTPLGAPGGLRPPDPPGGAGAPPGVKKREKSKKVKFPLKNSKKAENQNFKNS